MLFFLLLFGTIIGFINIVSAGGSMLTIPLLMFMGLPATVANGTNRISIIIQNLFAITQLSKQDKRVWKISLLASVPAVIGSIYGAKIAVNIAEETFNLVMIILMVTIITLILVKPQRMFNRKTSGNGKVRFILLLIAFLGIGVYGGFIQAGVGFLFIIMISLIYPRMTLLEIHTVKTIVITIYLSISTFIFISSGNVNWEYAIYLSIGTATGGYLGGRFAVNVPEKVLQIILVSIVILFSVLLLKNY